MLSMNDTERRGFSFAIKYSTRETSEEEAWKPVVRALSIDQS